MLFHKRFRGVLYCWKKRWKTRLNSNFLLFNFVFLNSVCRFSKRFLVNHLWAFRINNQVCSWNERFLPLILTRKLGLIVANYMVKIDRIGRKIVCFYAFTYHHLFRRILIWWLYLRLQNNHRFYFILFFGFLIHLYFLINLHIL